MNIAIVTGASSGMGREFVRQLIGRAVFQHNEISGRSPAGRRLWKP